MSNTLLMPGHRVCEYRLIICPSESLQESIRKMQAAFYEKYRLPLPATTKPHITILDFCAYESMQDSLVERMQQAIARTMAFTIEVENFCAYPTHSICIPVANPDAVHELTRELKVIKSIINLPQPEPRFIAEPHITIARKLKPFQFIRMWMDCENQQFRGKFTAKDILLLKRSFSNEKFDLLNHFELTSASLSIKQGVLFG